MAGVRNEKHAIGVAREMVKEFNTYDEGCKIILQYLPNINKNTRTPLYHAVRACGSSMEKGDTFRVPLYVELCKQVFALATEHSSKFTPGFRKRFEEQFKVLNTTVFQVYSGLKEPSTPRAAMSPPAEAEMDAFPSLDPHQVSSSSSGNGATSEIDPPALPPSFFRALPGGSNAPAPISSTPPPKACTPQLPTEFTSSQVRQQQQRRLLLPPNESGERMEAATRNAQQIEVGQGCQPIVGSRNSLFPILSKSLRTRETMNVMAKFCPYPFTQFVSKKKKPRIFDTVSKLPQRIMSHSDGGTDCIHMFHLTARQKEATNSMYRLHLLCTDSNGMSNYSMAIPKLVSFIINGQQAKLEGMGCQQLFGYDISKYLQMFGFGVRLVKTIQIEEMVTEIKRRNVFSRAESLSLVRDINAEMDGVEQLDSSLSLLCPITLTRIELPARGSACMHVQCFDLVSFLRMNQAKPLWSCPICSKFAYPADVGVDMLVYDILAATNSSVSNVRLHPDGVWEPRFDPDDVDEDSDDAQEEAMIQRIQLGHKRREQQTGPLAKRQRIEQVVDLT